MKSNRWPTFINSAFFVLGFGIIFSLLGVLLQTALSNVADSAMKWFGYAGGLIIIFFGFLLLGLVRVGFLEREHKFQVKRKFRYSYLSSFLFGSAFAVGWTPCVTAALGAILALAVTQSTSAFILLLAYTLGLGVPFLIVGWFTAEAQRAINKAGKYVKYIQIFFGILLILLGILIFTGELSRIANFESAANSINRILLTLNNFFRFIFLVLTKNK